MKAEGPCGKILSIMNPRAQRNWTIFPAKQQICANSSPEEPKKEFILIQISLNIINAIIRKSII